MANAYKIKVKIAYSYWMCGPEYIDIALAYNEAASGLFRQIETSFKGNEYPLELDAEQEKHGMLNNRCWYHLEKFWSLYKADRDRGVDVHDVYEQARAAFRELEPVLAGESISSNALDTAAWFNLCSFRMTLKQVYLEKAVDYSRRMIRHRNRATLAAMVTHLHSEHIREIAGFASALGTWRFGKSP